MNVRLPTPVEAAVGPVERKFDLREYVNFLWRQWPFIAAIAGLTVLVSLVYLIRTTPLYTATAQLLLDPRHEKVAGSEAILTDFQLDDAAAIESQLAIIKSDSLLRRVVTREGPASSRPVMPVQEEQLSPWRFLLGADRGAQPAGPESEQSAIGALRGAMAVSRSGESYVLHVSVTSPDPEKAARLANAIADAYVLDQLDARFEASQRASAWLSDRLVELRKQLHESEEAVAKFRTKNGLVRGAQNVTLNEQQLADLNSKLVAARADTAEKKTRVDFLGDVAAGKMSIDALQDSVQTSQNAPQASVLMTLRQRLVDVSQREADLLARYSSRHPAVANIQAEKRDIERNIANETQRMIAAVGSDYALAKAREGSLERSVRGASGEGGLDSEAAIQLRELERTAAVNKTLFEDFLQRAKIMEEQSTFQARDARIISPAQPPTVPSYPNTSLILTIALIAGIGLGAGSATAVEVLHAGFTTPGQIEDMGWPVLAVVRLMDKNQLTLDGQPLPVPLYQIHHPLSPFSEAIRTLRSGIKMSDVDRPPKVLQVTSSRPGEGKTTIALSMAISAGNSSQKVVLVDGDLRHPSATHFFKLDRAKGLVDVLAGACELGDALHVREDLNITILAAGAKSLNPPDVLGSGRMKDLVSQLREAFDYVVIDTPPVGPVVDPMIVSRLVDKTVFVVQWGATPRELVETCVRQISAQNRLAGITLNFLNRHRAKKYGREYYYGGGYYDKYYSE